MTRPQQQIATVQYDSGNVYQVYGWMGNGTIKNKGPFENPGKIERLGPDGYHMLESLDASRDEVKEAFDVKEIANQTEAMLQRALDIIEDIYEPDSECEHVRRLPINHFDGRREWWKNGEEEQ